MSYLLEGMILSSVNVNFELYDVLDVVYKDLPVQIPAGNPETHKGNDG